MASHGDYQRFQTMFASKNANVIAVAATTTQSGIITPKSANHQIWVQKISVEVTTYSAKTLTFQDSAGTPVPIAFISIPAAAVALPSESNSMVIDFGPVGIPLTLGKNLDLVISAAGAAFVAHVEAYEKLVGPVAAASTN